MGAATAVPVITIGPLGLVLPAESAILTGVLTDYNTAFGGNMNLSLNTPQGQLATSQAALIADYNDQFLTYINGVDPAYSSGRMQDAIGRIYFLERKPPLPTVVQVTCVGLANTVIPAGSLVKDNEGNLYTNNEAGTIPVGGSVVISFANTATGPIPCPAGAIDSAPFRQVNGWDSASNAADGVLGNDVESTQAFEARRQASVALNANAIVSAIRANVLQVPGVLDAYVYENPTMAPITYGGMTINANSVFVCAAGGDSLAVATAIWQKKPPGCGYTGSTTETVYDSSSGYVMPFPAYSVSFQIAAPLSISFSVNLAANPSVPSNAAALVQAAIINAFAGGDGGVRASIGSTIFASRFYAAVASLGNWVEIRSIQIGSMNTPAATGTCTVAGFTMTATVTSGSLAPGYVISAPGVTEGSIITAGSGGSGTYTLSQQSTVASPVAFVGYAVNLNSVSVNINQVPVTSNQDIVVSVT